MADNAKRWRLVCYCAFFLLPILASIILVFVFRPTLAEKIAIFCPETLFKSTFDEDCKTIPASKGAAWGGFIKNVSWRHEFLTLALFPFRDQEKIDTDKDVVVEVIYSYTILETTEDEEIVKTVGRLSNHRVTVFCPKGEKMCQQHTVEVLLDLTGKFYYFEITLEGLSGETPEISYLEFNAYSGSPVYTVFQLCMRNILFVLSFVTFAFYLFRTFKVIPALRIWEQKVILGLLIGLIIFDNPFENMMLFSLTLPAMLVSIFVTVIFLYFLLYSVWSWFGRIRLENDSVDSSAMTLWKLLPILFLTIFTLVCGSILIYLYSLDPGTNVVDFYFVWVLIVLLGNVILIGIVILFMGIETLRILCQWRSKRHRHKLFILTTWLYLIIVGATVAFGSVGVTGILQIFFPNIYIWFLAFLYTPTKQGLEQQKDPEFAPYPILKNNFNASRKVLEPLRQTNGVPELEMGPGKAENECFKEGQPNPEMEQAKYTPNI